MKNVLLAISDLLGLKSKRDKEIDSDLLAELGAKDQIKVTQAYAVLLVDMALIDQDFDKREYEYIFSVFERKFGLDGGEIRELIHQATTLITNLRSTEAFANHLKEKLSGAERQELGNILEKLITADEVEHGFELYLKERFSQLLAIVEE